MNTEFDSEKLDAALHGTGLDWSFDRPTDTGSYYYTIYIVEKSSDEVESSDEEDDICCEMCDISHLAALDEEDGLPGVASFRCNFAKKDYILCADCIPPNDVCSVKEWRDRDGTKTFNFEDECWDDYYYCVKCCNPKLFHPNRTLVPQKYLNGTATDEKWVYCLHTGWYCPNHSPTMNCDADECPCCAP